MKMEEQELSVAKPEMASDTPCVLQVGTLKPQPLKQEPEEALASQRWEMQWQEFLKVLQSPQAAWGNPPLPPPMLWGDPKASPVPVISSASSEAQGQNFRDFRYQETTTPREVYNRLRDRCLEWLKPERHTKEQIVELVILEQFLSLLPEEIQCWVKERGPETCMQAVALAEEFLQRQQEIKKWREKRSEGLVPEAPVDFPIKDGAAPDITQRQLCSEVKQEDQGEVASLGKACGHLNLLWATECW
uniref:SCAN box domain-containing protein n=1 Tax=Salvator merianae TaxID=96440 RepID=A0A8D0E2I5_SALMN